MNGRLPIELFFLPAIASEGGNKLQLEGFGERGVVVGHSRLGESRGRRAAQDSKGADAMAMNDKSPPTGTPVSNQGGVPCAASNLPGMENLLAPPEKLAQAVLNNPEAKAGDAGRAMIEDLAELRGEQQRVADLPGPPETQRDEEARTRKRSTEELAARLAELQRVSEENRRSRLAALNMMEDAIESREALRKAEERLRLVVENARDYAIFSLDLERRVTSWNAGAEAILGHAAEEALGQSADFVFTDEDRAAGAPELEAKTALTEGRAAAECWHVRKDGSRFWGSGVMTAMHDAQGGVIGFVKIFRDETQAREAQKALEENREELLAAAQENARARAEAERAREAAEAAGEAKNQFLAVLSHELRTPLTPIMMAAHSLARRKDLPEAVREDCAMILRNIQLEARFVDDLLDVTKIEHGKMELIRAPMDLHEAIRQAIEISKPDIDGKGQRLTVELEAKPCKLLGDRRRLQQVVWNLLKNAAKFTPEGGAIRVRTHSERGHVILEISDTGIGIEAEALPRIFDAFTQANISITREFGGLGLGLAIAKATVLSHDGEIQVESDGVGRGAKFTVTLPIFPGK